MYLYPNSVRKNRVLEWADVTSNTTLRLPAILHHLSYVFSLRPIRKPAYLHQNAKNLIFWRDFWRDFLFVGYLPPTLRQASPKSGRKDDTER